MGLFLIGQLRASPDIYAGSRGVDFRYIFHDLWIIADSSATQVDRASLVHPALAATHAQAVRQASPEGSVLAVLHAQAVHQASPEGTVKGDHPTATLTDLQNQRGAPS